ncbi:MAG: transposase [Bacteroidales bacterium]|jgi:transposase|nr:transposase [Bacteroidales bacterium]
MRYWETGKRRWYPGGEEELKCFDRFHVSRQFNRGLDQVRRKEQRELSDRKGKSVLTGCRYEWLKNGERSDNRERERRRSTR